MAIKGVDTKCYILALFVRDDGERFLLGSGHYEFKDTQMHFAANAIQNDIVEVQGNDGFLLAGQVRRPGTQSFDGYVGDGTMSKEETESYRRQFFSFFRKNFFYKVIYVFSDGTAIQRKSGFLVDDPTVEELYQMYPEYHVALNFEDVNYYSYSEDEEGQEQYAKEATIDTSSMRATGGLVWDEYGAVNQGYAWGGETAVSGTEFTVQNDLSLPAPITDTRLNGDTYQQTYSGKNLCDLGTKTVYQYELFPLTQTLPAGTYTFSAQVTSTDTQSSVCFVRFMNGSRGVGAGRISRSVERTFITVTTSDVANGLYLYAGYNASDSAGDTAVYTNIQIEAGSTATPYEPYVGGVPAPNPDYPQSINVATGSQTVMISRKNMLDSLNGFANAYIDSGGVQRYGDGANALFGYIQVKPSTAYTLSASTTTRMSFIYYDSSKTFISRDANIPDDSATVTTPATCEYVRIVIYRSIANGGVTQAYLEQLCLQFELGSQPTLYQPYASPQSFTVDLGALELCKIGAYQDYIYKSGNDWYVHKAVEKVVYDGTQSWTFEGGDGGAFFRTEPVIPTSTVDKYAISDKFLAYDSTNSLSVWSRYPYNVVAVRNRTTYAQIGIKTDVASTSSDFRTWLASNPTAVYFVLQTPTDTQITDATLVSQLNALGSAKLMVGENNVLVSATGTNLPAELQIKYYSTVSFDGAGFVWEEGGSGGATVVEVDSITNTYPIWRVKGPAVDPQLSVINTNTTIRYTGTVTSTQTLEIDMFNKTAKLNGVSVIGNVSGDWVSLAPGTNRVIYTAENADAQPSTIEWQEVVG